MAPGGVKPPTDSGAVLNDPRTKRLSDRKEKRGSPGARKSRRHLFRIAAAVRRRVIDRPNPGRNNRLVDCAPRGPARHGRKTCAAKSLVQREIAPRAPVCTESVPGALSFLGGSEAPLTEPSNSGTLSLVSRTHRPTVGQQVFLA